MAWLPVTQVSDLGGATPRRDTGRLPVGRDYMGKPLRQKKYAGTPWSSRTMAKVT
jgi:hypothetical protein